MEKNENGMQDEATAEIIIAHDKRYTDLHKTFSAAAHAPPQLADGAAPSSKFSFYHFFDHAHFFFFHHNLYFLPTMYLIFHFSVSWTQS